MISDRQENRRLVKMTLGKVSIPDLLLSGWKSDFTVRFNDRNYPLHREILAANAGFFRSLFDYNEKTGEKQDEVDFTRHPVIKPWIFDHLVDVWYGRNVTNFRYEYVKRLVIEDLYNQACAYLSCECPPLVFRSPFVRKAYIGIHRKTGELFADISDDDDDKKSDVHRTRWRPDSTKVDRCIDIMNQYLEYQTEKLLVNVIKKIGLRWYLQVDQVNRNEEWWMTIQLNQYSYHRCCHGNTANYETLTPIFEEFARDHLADLYGLT